MLMTVDTDLFGPALELLNSPNVVHYYSSTEQYELAIVASLIQYGLVSPVSRIFDEYSAGYDFEALLYMVFKRSYRLHAAIDTFALFDGCKVQTVTCKSFVGCSVVIEILFKEQV